MCFASAFASVNPVGIMDSDARFAAPFEAMRSIYHVGAMSKSRWTKISRASRANQKLIMLYRWRC